jgi:phage tail sheath protein FI
MAYSLSPGVTVSEIDLTTVIPTVATSIGAFAGHFRWGPINEVTTISNEVQLVDRFGKPDSNNYISFFSAANFLAYSNNLKVVRADATALRNSGTGGGVLIRNQIQYDSTFANGTSSANTVGPFVAKFAGELGNSIRYSICDANSSAYNSWQYKSYFASSPGTSLFVSGKGGSNDELHIIVVDANGVFTGTNGSILEKYDFVSRATDAKNSDGSSNYYKTVVNNKSKYLRWVADPRFNQLTGSLGNVYSGLSTTAFTANQSSNLTATLSGGVDATPVTANVQTGYSYFVNADDVDVGLIITGQHDSTVINYCTSSIAEVRKDCVVFASPKQTDVVDAYGSEATNITTTRNTLTASSYTIMDSGWKYQYDKYNDTYRYIPLNADIAGICAKTDQDRDPWFSPGGLNRGTIKNCVKLAYNPSNTDRDTLYMKQVNPVVTFPGQGTVLYGDKTLQVRPSAFDRINVRRLFIVLEKAVSRAAKYSLFEFNDAFTRAQFVALVEPYLRDVQGRRGILEFRVVCDETNNTPDVIDRNEFIGDIYIKPARSINYIQLNFIATRTGVNFDEIVGKF